MDPLPRLMCRHRHRITDPVNKLIASEKLKKHIKSAAMRWAGRSMQEHLVSKHTAWLQDILHVNLYSALVTSQFSVCNSVCLSWDGSNHQGKDTNVCIIYSNEINKAAYLNIQTLHPLRGSELSAVLDYKPIRTFMI